MYSPAHDELAVFQLHLVGSQDIHIVTSIHTISTIQTILEFRLVGKISNVPQVIINLGLESIHKQEDNFFFFLLKIIIYQ